MTRPTPPKQKVHNHGPDEGPGLGCPETRNLFGQLRGACMRAGDSREGIGPGLWPGYPSSDTPKPLPVVDDGPAPGARCMPVKSVAPQPTPGPPPRPVPNLPCPCRHPERHPEEHDWSRFTLVDETITVDGVEYDVAKIRALILERHQQAEEIIQLRLRVDALLERLRRADVHLQRRTQALTRLVARKGPALPKRGW